MANGAEQQSVKVGVTGHQEIGDADTLGWVRQAIKAAVRHYGVTQGFTSLAAGADQLYAEVLRELRIPYVAVLPSLHYDRTFPCSSDLARYTDLLDSASGAMTQADYDEPDEFAFLQAGRWIVQLSDFLIAVWDGETARGPGGTGDIVRFARAVGKKVVRIDPKSREVTVLGEGGQHHLAHDL